MRLEAADEGDLESLVGLFASLQKTRVDEGDRLRGGGEAGEDAG